uniref:Secreted protein n=1 Tax=Trichogramma kaykai TaxID=54128 RepID=A0ABD2WJ95_9HYME
MVLGKSFVIPRLRLTIVFLFYPYSFFTRSHTHTYTHTRAWTCTDEFLGLFFVEIVKRIGFPIGQEIRERAESPPRLFIYRVHPEEKTFFRLREDART